MNNILGIQQAINFAEENGYDTVVLPKGEYSLCYSQKEDTCIYIGNINFDAKKSEFRIIFDSTHFSPLENNSMSLRTPYYELNIEIFDSGEAERILCYRGSIYTRIAKNNQHDFHAYFFDSEYNLLNHLIVEPWENFEIPIGSKYIRGALNYQNSQSYTYYLGYGINYGNIIKNCISEEGHRGGLTGGGNYFIFDNITLSNNANKFNGTVFPDTTRYGYNQEDSYSNKVTIRNSVIENSFNPILFGVYNGVIDNCEIKGGVE